MKSYALYRRRANKQGDNISPCPTILISDLWMQNEGGQNKICNELFFTIPYYLSKLPVNILQLFVQWNKVKFEHKEKKKGKNIPEPR